MTNPDGKLVVEGEVIEADAPRACVALPRDCDEDVAGDRACRVTWELRGGRRDHQDHADVHDDFDGETATYRAVAGGWPLNLSALKTLLETGEPLRRAA